MSKNSAVRVGYGGVQSVRTDTGVSSMVVSGGTRTGLPMKPPKVLYLLTWTLTIDATIDSVSIPLICKPLVVRLMLNEVERGLITR